VEVVRRFTDNFEIIVINDGSTDDTAEVLALLEAEYAPKLRVIAHDRNLGYGAALRSGFQAAAKEYIFYTDGDGQYDPGDLELLLRAATPEAGLVNGFKVVRNDPWHRIAIGWVYNCFARWLFRIQLRDIDCDFRLIRRSAFDPSQLNSRGGTICVELVRQLELSGAEVVERPVRHYARQNGRSQFFRVRSLATTAAELAQVFMRLVLMPAVFGASANANEPVAEPAPSPRRLAAVVACLAALCVLAYARSLSLPLIADDYVQIQLSRDYGPFEKWSALAADALYRCRATSLVLTYWVERFFGSSAGVLRGTSLILHVINTLLVFGLGVWRPIGWRLSALAAAFFAIYQRHSEAVIWYAAVPELLVFTFVLAGFLVWIVWLQSSKHRWGLYPVALALFLLALLSKESAVVLGPLCALSLVATAERNWRRWMAVVPFGALSAAYFGFAWAARANHLHFNDGTFSLQAPFLEVIVRSMGGLLWVWGGLAMVLTLLGLLKVRVKLISLAVVWMVVCLLPYSFLTYMPRVPSRHTYLASLGLSILVGAALLSLRWRSIEWRRAWLVPATAGLILIHQCGYIWTVQHHRYQLRAEPTELLLRVARGRSATIYASCFPYSPVIADWALAIVVPQATRPAFEVGPSAAKQSGAQDFCNQVAEGVRY
jgi:hypothetical protein